jgi:hypothetical protein
VETQVEASQIRMRPERMKPNETLRCVARFSATDFKNRDITGKRPALPFAKCTVTYRNGTLFFVAEHTFSKIAQARNLKIVGFDFFDFTVDEEAVMHIKRIKPQENQTYLAKPLSASPPAWRLNGIYTQLGSTPDLFGSIPRQALLSLNKNYGPAWMNLKIEFNSDVYPVFGTLLYERHYLDENESYSDTADLFDSGVGNFPTQDHSGTRLQVIQFTHDHPPVEDQHKETYYRGLNVIFNDLTEGFYEIAPRTFGFQVIRDGSQHSPLPTTIIRPQSESVSSADKPAHRVMIHLD